MKDPLLIYIYAYLLLLILKLANPYGFNVTGWFIFIRVTMRNLLFFYLGLHVFNSMKDVYVFFKYWLIMGTLAAVYACMQQWIDLMPYERAFMAKYPKMFNTTIIITWYPYLFPLWRMRPPLVLSWPATVSDHHDPAYGQAQCC